MGQVNQMKWVGFPSDFHWAVGPVYLIQHMNSLLSLFPTGVGSVSSRVGILLGPGLGLHCRPNP